METNNPGTMLDDMGVTCEMLYERMRRTGDHSSQQAMWNACQEFSHTITKIDQQYPDEFGGEM